MSIEASRLIAACGDDAYDAGITIRTRLEPLGGPGATVKPAVYAGGHYQIDRRWFGDDSAREPVDTIVIDNVPSQANRLEAALERLRAVLGLPEIVLDLSDLDLPPHLPDSLSIFRFPHRQADAYLRDSLLDGKPFPKTEIGTAIMDATAEKPIALMQWCPQALLFGFWQSHLGKKRSQAKLARSWVSEIVGYRPASYSTRVLGLKGDPLNLTTEEKVQYDPDDTSDWQLLEGSEKVGGRKQKESLAELGHGQVPVSDAEAALAGVSFYEIEQLSTVSFAALRRIWFGEAEANASGRALLAALGLVAHSAAFGRSFSLRSGCELSAESASWRWLGTEQDAEVPPLEVAGAADMFGDCVERAARAGLPVASKWPAKPLQIKPNEQLAKVIGRTYPVEE